MSSENELRQKAYAIAALAENYDHRLSEPLLGLWLELLDPYSVAQVNHAVRKVILEYAYNKMPPFAVLAQALKGNRQNTMETEAIEAWQTVLAAIDKYGTYGKPIFDSVTESALRAIGGWENLCLGEIKYLQMRQKEFVRYFAIYTEQAETNLALGVCDHTGEIPDEVSQLATEKMARITKNALTQ